MFFYQTVLSTFIKATLAYMRSPLLFAVEVYFDSKTTEGTVRDVFVLMGYETKCTYLEGFSCMVS